MELKSLESITLAELKPAKVRKDLKKVSKHLKNFECCIENYDPAFPFSILHYAFMFRRFDAVAMIKKSLSENEWNEALLIKGPKRYEWITPLDKGRGFCLNRKTFFSCTLTFLKHS